MNSTDDSSGILGGGNDSGGFSYGIGVSVGILLLITIISLSSYFCARNEQHQRPNSAAAAASEGPDQPPEAECAVDIGIDEATLLSYPKLLYSSKENLPKKDSTASCCSICLADYKSDDLLRLLPDCGHAFHLRCVDPWLRLHATCPVCRTSPTVTPLSTPLVEVSPLAARR
ncbi:hypothetical protein Nepgr_024826 [Nepenthes gracilis]|uniref:RING-type domain-containing protein n=1 Tax=Nepenthes gracilis TaxID=150966 RepID=A0AAD3T3K8_NEPGR|nr:hypothetical protein Nepgr_024826 [Nepenthes gracilis]